MYAVTYAIGCTGFGRQPTANVSPARLPRRSDIFSCLGLARKVRQGRVPPTFFVKNIISGQLPPRIV